MNRADFLKAVKSLGFKKKGDSLWARVRLRGECSLIAAYDDDGRPQGIKEQPRSPNDRFRRDSDLGIHLEPVEIDHDFHFVAAILADHGGEELVHVLEPGPYFDHIFLNLHDEGLSTVEDLIDADDFDPSTLRAVYSEEGYEDVSKQTRIEWQPFFQNPVARSLQELVDLFEVVRK